MNNQSKNGIEKDNITLKFKKDRSNYKEFINKLNSINSSGVDEIKSKVYIYFKLPIDCINYIEYHIRNMKIFLIKDNLSLVHESVLTKNGILNIINQNTSEYSGLKYVNISDIHLVRAISIKAIDTYNKKILLNVSGDIWLPFSRSQKYKLIMILESLSSNQGLWLIKSTDKKIHLINPINVKFIKSYNKLKYLYMVNYFTEIIKIKYSTSKQINDFFKLNNKLFLTEGSFIQLNKNVILNFYYFKKENLKGDTYYDSLLGEVIVDRIALKELNE